jgi:putative ABC transport system ATP-binding protein
MAEPAIDLHDVRYAWPGQPACLHLRVLQVARGQSVFVHGPSGSGKTTLLSLLALVLAPQNGRVALLGRDTTGWSGAARDRFRADHIGYVFQQFNLLPYLPVLANVELPLRMSAARRDRAPAGEARALLRSLGIDGALLARTPAGLSVGQQQRVAAARALVGSPEIVIADEPTSALDELRRDEFMKLLMAGCARVGSTLVFVSHDVRLANRFDRALALSALNDAALEAAP